MRKSNTVISAVHMCVTSHTGMFGGKLSVIMQALHCGTQASLAVTRGLSLPRDTWDLSSLTSDQKPHPLH